MTNPINELDLQRCVDGELPLVQRRAFLEQLDHSTDGWKSLALAFLESQDFTAGCAEFRDGPAASGMAMNLERREAGRGSALPMVIQGAALAATVAAAFWLGTRSGRRADAVIAGRDALPTTTAGADERPRTYGPADTENSDSLAANDPDRGPQPTAVLKLPFKGTDDEELAIPVYDQRTLASEDGAEIPLVWPTVDESTALSAAGYRVKSERNLLSFPLETGDTVYVPVEVSGVMYAVQ